LRSILKEKNRISPPMLATVTDQMLSGVSAAHRAGVLHRDIKPENILIVTHPPGTLLVKIVDFGLAKMLFDDSGGFATATGVRMGTAGYMAPEQSKAAKVDERADIFSLGVTLFELLTGYLPDWVLPNEMLAPIEGLEDDRLRSLVGRCVALNPDHRIDSVDSLRAELRGLLGGSQAAHPQL
jgi:serine/threonine protein kinase